MTHESKESLGKYGILLKRGWTWHVVEGDHWTHPNQKDRVFSFEEACKLEGLDE